jgi:hypothetical protein
MHTVSFLKLDESDLFIDAIYEGGNAGNAGDDPISKLLLGTGNQGGFRLVGSKNNRRWIVLYTSGEDTNWPDTMDTLTGTFTYYGDNKRPGQELHATSKGGNAELRDIFAARHLSSNEHSVPPIFVFRKCPTEKSARSVQFLGLAVPGTANMQETEDLITLWKSADGKRFQNYRATFTILDIAAISRQWIKDLQEGFLLSKNAPNVWRNWVNKRTYKPLIAIPTSLTRSAEAQRPHNATETLLLKAIWNYFGSSSDQHAGAHAFEHFAAWVFSLTDNRVVIDEVTRRSLDHGRDAVGHYKLGLDADPIVVDFALEAKCYEPGLESGKANTIGVKETSRLISRLLHRQFGVLVTTSVIAETAYAEIREDKHPVILIAGGDIARILIASGISTPAHLKEELKAFPIGN